MRTLLCPVKQCCDIKTESTTQETKSVGDVLRGAARFVELQLPGIQRRCISGIDGSARGRQCRSQGCQSNPSQRTERTARSTLVGSRGIRGNELARRRDSDPPNIRRHAHLQARSSCYTGEGCTEAVRNRRVRNNGLSRTACGLGRGLGRVWLCLGRGTRLTM